jgi:8-oxo-dGTP pyrophosphatase MutT (NUDIX family)
VTVNRRELADALARYAAEGPGEAASLDRLRRFVGGAADPFARENPEGHVTGSAVVARPDGSAFLLVLHRKLSRWLQPGGHTEEEDATVFDAALREAREETGIAYFDAPLGKAIFDVDVHPIPARGRDPAHLHFDVRYLFTSRSDADPEASDDPSRPMRWASFEEAVSLGIDASLERALRKARRALGAT